ncbi:MAG: hypothetical protein RLN76_12405 [Phycisphaeraceae bacterium]
MDRREQIAGLRLEKTRKRLSRGERDLTLGFMQKQFQVGVERPWKRLSEIIDVWGAVMPAAVVERTRLQGLQRGVLRVGVSDSAMLYEVDRLLRSGLQRELVQRIKGGGATLRKVRLSVDPMAAPTNDDGSGDLA